MNFTLSVYNISSCHFSKRHVENCLRKLFGLSSCWMNESCDKPCYPHDYITCAKQDLWLMEPSWQARSLAWKSCMILSGISNPARQPAPVEDEECVMASGSLLLLSHTFISCSKAAHALIAETSHSQGTTFVYRGFQTGLGRNCCLNLNVLAACQMTRPRRSEVRPAVAQLCHDFAMSPNWLIRNHENSQTFSVSFSEVWLQFALQSEPSEQWAPAGDVFTGSRSKGISRQKHKSSPQLCCWIWWSIFFQQALSYGSQGSPAWGTFSAIIARRHRKQSFPLLFFFFPVLPSQKERTSRTQRVVMSKALNSWAHELLPSRN